MHRRKDIQELLTSRRARLTRNQAGLASFGDKCRVPGLRREEAALLVPAVNQIKVHPYFAQRDVQALNAEHGILSQTWSPIGGIGITERPCWRCQRSITCAGSCR